KPKEPIDVIFSITNNTLDEKKIEVVLYHQSGIQQPRIIFKKMVNLKPEEKTNSQKVILSNIDKFGHKVSIVAYLENGRKIKKDTFFEVLPDWSKA
ncbi:MAG: hypothetical protein NC824_01585, partial [Candidatus Omnitrophica bacterium]|nr:hypothetical protein [Candidatus Omnitrophota bacterium]